MLNSNFNKRTVKSRFLAGKTINLIFAILFAAGLTSIRAQDTWIQKADVGGMGRWAAVGFSIGSKGYIGTGVNGTSTFLSDFWEYDPLTDAWTQKADFGGGARYAAVGFSIGSKGYIGTGQYADPYNYYDDFWEYDPAVNAWTQKADFAGTARYFAVGFSNGSQGYIGTGDDGSYKKDFWEYDPATDVWTQKTNFGGSERRSAVGFSIGSKGYIGTGCCYFKDFWEYDPATNSWTQKADFGGGERYTPVGFSIGAKGYIGTGFYDLNDFWEYDPATNDWTQKANFGGTGRGYSVGFSIGNKGYLGTGIVPIGYKDFWEYTPGTSSCAVPTNLSVTNITSSSATLNWDAVAGAEGYKIRYKVSGTDPWTLKYSNGNSKNLNNLSSNTSYTWEVKTFCSINPGVSSDWSAKQEFTTGTLRFGDESVQQVSFQIYPNPAEDHATIQFTLPYSSRISINVYDLSGREVATLLEGDLQQGIHSLQLNTTQFSKGVYMVRMISDFGIENQKLIVQ